MFATLEDLCHKLISKLPGPIKVKITNKLGLSSAKFKVVCAKVWLLVTYTGYDFKKVTVSYSFITHF